MTHILKRWDELRKRKNPMSPHNLLGFWSWNVRRSHSWLFFSLDHKFHYLEIMFFFQQKKLRKNWNPVSTRVVRNVCIFFYFFVSCIAEATWNVFRLLLIFLWNKFYCLWIVFSWQLLRPKAFFPAAEWSHNKKQLHLQLPHNVKPLCLSPDLVSGQLSPCGVSRLWHQLLRCLT